MKIFGVIALALALMVATGPASAQDAGRERRLTLSRDLISLSAGPNFTKQVEQFVMGEIEKVGDQQSEEAVWVRANMPGMVTRMMNRLMSDMAPIYADTFTEEELTAQVDFFRTPIGRRIAAKTVQVGVAQEQVLQEAMMGFLTEFQAKYCAEFDCGEDAGQTSAKSGR